MSQIEIIKSALNSPVASLLPPRDLANHLTDIISNLYQYCGQSKDPDTLYFQVEELQICLQDNFKFLKIDEVKIALRNGVNGKYGEWKGLNPKAYLMWLNAYKMDEDRIIAKKTDTKSLPEHSLTDEDYKRMLDICYTQWINTGIIYDYGNIVYQWLVDKKYIKDDWNDYYQSSEEEEIKELTSEKAKLMDRMDRIGVNRINTQLIDLLPSSAKSKAKTKALEIFFLKLKDA